LRNQQPVATAGEAAAAIEKLTGLKRSPTQVRAYLHRLGIKRRSASGIFNKVGTLPAKADVQKHSVSGIKTQALEPRLAEAQAGRRAVLFLDAAHCVLGAFIGYLWSFTRLFVKTPSACGTNGLMSSVRSIPHLRDHA
jgi:hypothetical protein